LGSHAAGVHDPGIKGELHVALERGGDLRVIAEHDAAGAASDREADRVVDVAPDSLVIESTGTGDKIDGLLDVLRPFGVIEMARTGRLAMARGPKSAAAAPTKTEFTPDDISYSV